MSRSKIFQNILDNPQNTDQNIMFIGMSGAGKSHWSKEFSARFNMPRVAYDHLIAGSEAFKKLIEGIEGDTLTQKMGNYFGMPWEGGFKEKEAAYLNLEDHLMMTHKPDGGHILDTTGSAIYCPEGLNNLKTNAITIYLETAPEKYGDMLEEFKRTPKPVCWAGEYSQLEGEDHHDALSRCYEILLNTRHDLYQKFADVTISCDIHKVIENADELVTHISKQLDQ